MPKRKVKIVLSSKSSKSNSKTKSPKKEDIEIKDFINRDLQFKQRKQKLLKPLA